MGKRRPHKRLFPKKDSSSYIKLPRIDHFKAAAYNQQRSKTTQGRREDSEHILNNSFMQPIPETRRGPRVPSMRALTMDAKHELMVHEALGVYEMYRIWQSGTLQGVTHFNHVTLKQVADYKLILYFAGNTCILVMEFEGVRMISWDYESRDQAMSASRSNTVRWRLEEKISSDL